jgi:hypothetical protein
MGFWSDPIGNTIKAVKETFTGGGSGSSSTSGSSSRKDSKVSGSSSSSSSKPGMTTGSGANLLTDGMSLLPPDETFSDLNRVVNGQTVQERLDKERDRASDRQSEARAPAAPAAPAAPPPPDVFNITGIDANIVNSLVRQGLFVANPDGSLTRTTDGQRYDRNLNLAPAPTVVDDGTRGTTTTAPGMTTGTPLDISGGIMSVLPPISQAGTTSGSSARKETRVIPPEVVTPVTPPRTSGPDDGTRGTTLTPVNEAGILSGASGLLDTLYENVVGRGEVDTFGERFGQTIDQIGRNIFGDYDNLGDLAYQNIVGEGPVDTLGEKLGQGIGLGTDYILNLESGLIPDLRSGAALDQVTDIGKAIAVGVPRELGEAIEGLGDIADIYGVLPEGTQPNLMNSVFLPALNAAQDLFKTDEEKLAERMAGFTGQGSLISPGTGAVADVLQGAAGYLENRFFTPEEIANQNASIPTGDSISTLGFAGTDESPGSFGGLSEVVGKELGGTAQDLVLNTFGPYGRAAAGVLDAGEAVGAARSEIDNKVRAAYDAGQLGENQLFNDALGAYNGDVDRALAFLSNEAARRAAVTVGGTAALDGFLPGGKGNVLGSAVTKSTLEGGQETVQQAAINEALANIGLNVNITDNLVGAGAFGALTGGATGAATEGGRQVLTGVGDTAGRVVNALENLTSRTSGPDDGTRGTQGAAAFVPSSPTAGQTAQSTVASAYEEQVPAFRSARAEDNRQQATADLQTAADLIDAGLARDGGVGNETFLAVDEATGGRLNMRDVEAIMTDRLAAQSPTAGPDDGTRGSRAFEGIEALTPTAPKDFAGLFDVDLRAPAAPAAPATGTMSPSEQFEADLRAAADARRSAPAAPVASAADSAPVGIETVTPAATQRAPVTEAVTQGPDDGTRGSQPPRAPLFEAVSGTGNGLTRFATSGPLSEDPAFMNISDSTSRLSELTEMRQRPLTDLRTGETFMSDDIPLGEVRTGVHTVRLGDGTTVTAVQTLTGAKDQSLRKGFFGSTVVVPGDATEAEISAAAGRSQELFDTNYSNLVQGNKVAGSAASAAGVIPTRGPDDGTRGTQAPETTPEVVQEPETEVEVVTVPEVVQEPETIVTFTPVTSGDQIGPIGQIGQIGQAGATSTTNTGDQRTSVTVDADTSTAVEPAPEVVVETDPVVEAAPEVVVETDPVVEVVQDPETEVEVVQDPETEVEVVQDPETEVEVVQDPETEVEVVQDPETEVEVVQDPETEVEVVQDPEVEVEVVQDPETEVEVDTAPDTEVEIDLPEDEEPPEDEDDEDVPPEDEMCLRKMRTTFLQFWRRKSRHLSAQTVSAKCRWPTVDSPVCPTWSARGSARTLRRST